MVMSSRPPSGLFHCHLHSPPPTPAGARYQIRSAPQTRHASPISKRMGMSQILQTPPSLEFIEPIGQGPRFNFTRPQSLHLSSRTSSASGRAIATTPPESESEREEISDAGSEEMSEEEPRGRPTRRAERAYFILEEYESDAGYECDIEVIFPDDCEDAKSEISILRNGDDEVRKTLHQLSLGVPGSDDEEQQRRYRRKKKRWSAGVFKRSHSKSVEGDSSYSDNDPRDDVNPKARRLRRRVRGPFDRRGSLIFQDPGYANTNNILEVDEPVEGMVMHTRGPPSIPSDDAFTLDELPFWKMEVEFETDEESLLECDEGCPCGLE